jgi:hypothetical protein
MSEVPANEPVPSREGIYGITREERAAASYASADAQAEVDDAAQRRLAAQSGHLGRESLEMAPEEELGGYPESSVY